MIGGIGRRGPIGMQWAATLGGGTRWTHLPEREMTTIMAANAAQVPEIRLLPGDASGFAGAGAGAFLEGVAEVFAGVLGEGLEAGDDVGMLAGDIGGL